MPQLSPLWQSPETLRAIARLDICLVGGEDDFLVGETREMVRTLEALNIPHRGHVWSAPFGHDWPWWKQQICHYVPLRWSAPSPA